MRKVLIGLLIAAVILGSVFLTCWVMPLAFIAFIGWAMFRIKHDKNYNDDMMTDEHYNQKKDEVLW